MDPRTPDPDATSNKVETIDPLEIENQRLREEIALLKAKLEKVDSALKLTQVANEQLRTAMLHVSEKVTVAYRRIKDCRDLARIIREYPKHASSLRPMMKSLEEHFAADIADAMTFLNR